MRGSAGRSRADQAERNLNLRSAGGRLPRNERGADYLPAPLSSSQSTSDRRGAGVYSCVSVSRMVFDPHFCRIKDKLIVGRGADQRNLRQRQK
jgi:hypothetical protein